jgi:anti-sigma factor RsiW
VTCRELTDFIMGYVEGELPAESREPFERHLSRCPNCEAYVRQYADTIRAGKRACDCPEDELPASVPEELVQTILAARRTL